MSVGCLWDECECCVFVASTELGQLESKEPVGQIRGAGVWAGGAEQAEGLCWYSGICECVRACEP